MSILQSRRLKAGIGILYKLGTWAIDGATQANQEGETTNKVVTSDVQHFGPSAAKWWGFATVSAGTPTLQASYNVTSITDTAVGQLTWTIATDFSSANWSPYTSVAPNAVNAFTYSGTPAAGTLVQVCVNIAGPAAHDPLSWSAGGFGDQA